MSRTHQTRRAALASKLRAVPVGDETKSLDAVLITALPNIRYLTGFTGSNAMLLLDSSGDAILYTDPRYAFQAGREVSCRVKVSKGPLQTDLARNLKKRGRGKVGFEAQRLGYDSYEYLRAQLPAKLEMIPTRGLVETARMCKSPEELAWIRQSVVTNSKAFEAGVARLRPGRTTEGDLASEFEYQMRRLGAERAAFDTIVLGGSATALPHARPSSRILGADELLLVDMGATQGGYASDMTRMLYLGRPGRKVKHLYKAVLEAQLAALAAVHPGVTAGSIDRAARNVLKKYGFDRAFMHSTGHGLGLEIHEPPRLGRRDKTRLEPGMAITIEPGVYLEGFGGVRIEDTVVVNGQGCEILTPTPKELLEV